MFFSLKLSKLFKFFIIFLSFILIFYLLFLALTASCQSIQTSSLPSTSNVVIIDAGHGQPDGGATSANGISEESINLKIAYKVKELLEQSNISVILTRTDENGIYDSSCSSIKEMKTSDIKNRTKIGNNSNADIFVSIHLNKINESKYWGWQTFFQANNQLSQQLANNIQQSLNSEIQKENKRECLKLSNIYIMDHISIPTCIVECGFLSNPDEELLLQTDDYQSQLAKGIANRDFGIFKRSLDFSKLLLY